MTQDGLDNATGNAVRFAKDWNKAWSLCVLAVPVCAYLVYRYRVQISNFFYPYTRFYSSKKVTWNVVIDLGMDLNRADEFLWKAVRAKATSEYGTDIDIQVTHTVLDSTTTTIIVCPVSSRLGSNAEHAMKGLPSRRNMILLLFHPSEPHVNANPHSQAVLTDPKFTQLGAVVDVLYSQQYGFYDCPTNANAVDRLAEFTRIE